MFKKVMEAFNLRQGVTYPPQKRAHFIMRRDAFEWTDWINRELVGWKIMKPQPGDYLFCPMASGKIMVFRFSNIIPDAKESTKFRAFMSDLGYALDTRTAVGKDGAEITIEPDERFGVNFDYEGIKDGN